MENIAIPDDSGLARCFRGVAKVPIDALNFDHRLFKEQHRPHSEKIVCRLQSIFRREGCLRWEQDNWIEAVVGPGQLEYALAQNGLTAHDIDIDSESYPLLNLQSVDCLQGLHRIRAASDLLDQNDQ